MRTTSALGLFLATALLASPAQAILGTHGAAQLELPDGREGKVQLRVITRRAPAPSSRALLLLEADVNGPVAAMFDGQTGIPLRAWGFSVAAPGATASPEIAAKDATELLRRHLQLLAPGATEQDFALVLNHQSPGARHERGGAQRTVGFAQSYRGMPVLGGSVSFRFRGDRLFAIASDALPRVDAEVPDAILADEAAADAARRWIEQGLIDQGAARADVSSVDGPFVLPIADGDRIAYRVVLRVRVASASPVGLWDVFVDAGTGEPVARAQQLHFASAHLAIEAWERSPHFGERMTYAADRVALSIGDLQATSESAPDGTFSFEGESTSGTATLLGSHVRVRNNDGEDVALAFDASADAAILWSSPQETVDAQLNAFVHADLVNAYARSFAPDLAFLDQRVEVEVNIEDVCNAYSDGTTIHFYKAGSGCENTARLADVVYHEYGHSLHAHAFLLGGPGLGGGIPDGALSEGISDYLAATITGDPGMGRGFFMDDAPLRSVDPDGREHVWPDDVVGEVHDDGLIIGGALWDLRVGLAESLGEEEGVAHADWLMFEGIRRAANMPEMYAEILFADDDDGDIANGTPNECVINAAFGRHGLRTLEGAVAAPALAPPQQDGYEVVLEIQGLSAACGESLSNAYMTWSDPSNPTRGGLIDMSVEGDAIARGHLPPQPQGSAIVFDVRVENQGSELHFPQNPADPSYQMFVGEVTPIACFDFEADPFLQGWSHELVAGTPGVGADDWMWGSPRNGQLSGDPLGAFSGSLVVGQDLTPTPSSGEPDWNGLYQDDKHSALLSPTFDVTGFDVVRLQYRRWLNVEDGHFDRASILANGQVAWTNHDSTQGDASAVHHEDREWRFHDLDVTGFVTDGQLALRWELQSDGGVALGGWTLDDVCIVGVQRAATGTCAPGTAGCPTAPPAEPPVDDDGAGGAGDSLEADDDGCGCEVAGDRGASGASVALLAGLGALALGLRRRRR